MRLDPASNRWTDVVHATGRVGIRACCTVVGRKVWQVVVVDDLPQSITQAAAGLCWNNSIIPRSVNKRGACFSRRLAARGRQACKAGSAEGCGCHWVDGTGTKMV